MWGVGQIMEVAGLALGPGAARAEVLSSQIRAGPRTFSAYPVSPIQQRDPPQASAQPMSVEEIQKLAGTIDDSLKSLKSRIGFAVQEETGKIYVKIVDKSTGEVIKTIPPEEFLKIAAKFMRMRRTLGLVVDLSE
jgi:uncharacterized FlaG/YvyC family protein